jgi:hypothetical protein
MRHDGAGALDGDLGLELGFGRLVGRPAVVEGLARHGLETPLNKGARAAEMAHFSLRIAGHGLYCIYEQYMAQCRRARRLPGAALHQQRHA